MIAPAGAEPVVGAPHPAVQRLQFFLSEAHWDAELVNDRRLELLMADAAAYTPAGRLPGGQPDPGVAAKPQIVADLLERAVTTGCALPRSWPTISTVPARQAPSLTHSPPTGAMGEPNIGAVRSVDDRPHAVRADRLRSWKERECVSERC
ncbi:hypothetical protein [Micromonospora fulviviridis]|uniref:Transposase IS701-like DDE domain-containing protein n=1 Tax=Micromonospora fulviviridis TaxID=47860 RepID=A0ABV2VHD2_9ACTN